jgi:VRR-NUC domain
MIASHQYMPRNEYAQQVALFEWAGWNVGRYPELKWLNGSLNGVRLPPGLAKKMKAAGLKAGIPDIDLPVRRGEFCGLRIELKDKGGRLSGPQGECLDFLNEQGYMACVCVGADAAISTIESYLNHE